MNACPHVPEFGCYSIPGAALHTTCQFHGRYKNGDFHSILREFFGSFLKRIGLSRSKKMIIDQCLFKRSFLAVRTVSGRDFRIALLTRFSFTIFCRSSADGQSPNHSSRPAARSRAVILALRRSFAPVIAHFSWMNGAQIFSVQRRSPLHPFGLSALLRSIRQLADSPTC